MKQSPLYLSLTTALLLSGCMTDTEQLMNSFYNVPYTETTQFDGDKVIRMEKVVCSDVAFELYQDTPKHKQGVVLLKAGVNSIKNIGRGESLFIKLDGKVHSFESDDVNTDHDRYHQEYGVTTPFSHKSFLVSEKVIRDVANAKEFLAKVRLLDNTYVEGKCSAKSIDEYTDAERGTLTQADIDRVNKYTAHTGFKTFVDMMSKIDW